MNHLKNNRGFTLIEVLISIFLLSFGLLAAAAMQTTAMTGNTSSSNTTVSTQMAGEMLDRIRGSAGNSPEFYNNLNTGTCAGLITPAAEDCTQWRDRLRTSGLPNAIGQVTVTADSPIFRSATVTVTVTWGIGGLRRTRVSTVIETWVA